MNYSNEDTSAKWGNTKLKGTFVERKVRNKNRKENTVTDEVLRDTTSKILKSLISKGCHSGFIKKKRVF